MIKWTKEMDAIIHECYADKGSRKVQVRLEWELDVRATLVQINSRAKNIGVKNHYNLRAGGLRDRSRELIEAAERERDTWHTQMMTMPATPVKFVPAQMRFDGRR